MYNEHCIYHSINGFEILSNYKIPLICIDNQGQRIKHTLILYYFFCETFTVIYFFVSILKLKNLKQTTYL